jgi:DNA-binding NtrC family response regulator
MSVRELTDAYIAAALETAEGRKSEAARLLGMNRRTLYRREERQDGSESEGDSA